MRENGKCNPSQWDDFDERSCELGLLAVACYSFSLGIPALRKNVCSVSLHQIMKPLVKNVFLHQKQTQTLTGFTFAGFLY